MTVHTFYNDYAHGFVQQIAEVLRQSVQQGLGGGNDANEKTAFQNLPTDWAARLQAYNGGFVVNQVGQQLTVTSPNGAWTLTLQVTAN